DFGLLEARLEPDASRSDRVEDRPGKAVFGLCDEDAASAGSSEDEARFHDGRADEKALRLLGVIAEPRQVRVRGEVVDRLDRGVDFFLRVFLGRCGRRESRSQEERAQGKTYTDVLHGIPSRPRKLSNCLEGLTAILARGGGDSTPRTAS